MRVLVTGGLGFVGSSVVRHLIDHTSHTVVNVDCMTYAASEEAVSSVAADDRYHFALADIVDEAAIVELFERFRPEGVIHLAAETHVDRSIDRPADFIRANVVGTHRLLEASLHHVRTSDVGERFRFVHVSTDEVFGPLGVGLPAVTAGSAYAPRSPYAASKASSDHLARAWHATYGLPVIVVNSSNAYGPYQLPEKLIPLMVVKASQGQELPVYGTGRNVRDWLHVEDLAGALVAALEHGTPGETFLLGAGNERTNLDVVHQICDLMDERRPPAHRPRRDLVRFVPDRPGHDFRYAVDATAARNRLGWSPLVPFDEGLGRTVDWYLANEDWWRGILADRYDGSRLGSPGRW